MLTVLGVILFVGIMLYCAWHGARIVAGVTALFVGILSIFPRAWKAHKETPRTKYTGPKVSYWKNIFMIVVLFPFFLMLGPFGLVLWMILFGYLIKDIRRVNNERCN